MRAGGRVVSQRGTLQAMLAAGRRAGQLPLGKAITAGYREQRPRCDCSTCTSC